MNKIIIIHLVIAIVAILPAILMRFVNLDNPNIWFGYRTPASLKSKHTWRFANQYSGKIITWVALSTLLTQIFVYFTIDSHEAQILISAGVMTFGIFLVLALTEIKMTQLFDKNGQPKDSTSDMY